MNKNLDILIMTDNSVETVGGEQESTKIILENMKKKYAIGLIQPGNLKKIDKEIQFKSITSETRLKHLIKKPWLFFKYLIDVRKLIVEFNPKIIHTQSQVSFFIVSLLRKLRVISNETYLIHTERGLYSKYKEFIKKIFFFFLKELDILVTTTKFNHELWAEGIQKANLSVKTEIIENTAGELFEFYDSSLEEATDGFTVGFAGRYTDWKNWPLAVDISKKLYTKFGDKVKIKMAIGCLDQDALNQTQRMYDELTSVLGDQFTGLINISLKEMNQFYYDIDFFILTSNRNTESFGRTLVEAMSRKTVVLTTPAGGAVEVVGNDSNVLEDTEDFVNKVSSFFDKPKSLKKEKTRNFKRVKENYSLKNNVEKHIKLYEQILS